MKNIAKKNKLLIIVMIIYSVVFILTPDKAVKSLGNSVYYLFEMLQVLPVIFLLTVVIEALVPKELIMKGFGEKSGFKGNVLALLLGSISAGPIYAAFPISKSLLGKGASISNIVIILSAWAVIKVPMLVNELKFLGIDFMVVRWVLTVIAIFAIACITRAFVKRKDMPAEGGALETGTLVIKKEYCVGCGLCVKTLPKYYEMRGNKAFVIMTPIAEEAKHAVEESAKKCPAKAIIFTGAISCIK